MSLLEQVNELIINNLTTDLAHHISDEFGLDSIEVSNAIKKYLDQMSTPATPIMQVIVHKPAVKTPVQKEPVCLFVFQRGPKKGTQCGTILRKDSDYCSKHKHRKMLTNNNGMVHS